jgi:anti-sigma B factor antagonist
VRAATPGERRGDPGLRTRILQVNDLPKPSRRFHPAARAPFFSVTRDSTGDWIVARGEIDMVTAPQLAAAIDAGPCLGVDMSEVSFLDVSGLRVLLDAARRNRAAGKRFSVVRPSPMIRRLLELTAVDQSVDIVDQVSATTSR